MRTWEGRYRNYFRRTSVRCRFRIYSHEIISLPENINYVHTSIRPGLPRLFFFLIHRCKYILFCQFSLPALSPRAIARLYQFDTQTINIVCHEIRRPTGVLELHFDDEEWKGARCGPRSFSCGDGFTRTLNIHFMQHLSWRDRGSPGKSRGLRDIRWYRVITEMQIISEVNAPLNDRLGISLQLDLFLSFVEWK